MSRRLDLDRLRAARLEAAKEPPLVTLGGEEFVLPAELPAEFVVVAARGDMEEAVGTLLDPADVERFWKVRPSVADLMALFEGAPGLYGLDVGEPSASENSSPDDGTNSKPTSNGSTRSTSHATFGGNEAARADSLL